MNRAYTTKTRKYQVGCGELRVRIAVKKDGSFHFILASLDNQDNECGCCWLDIVGNGLTALLRRVHNDEVPDFVKNLKGQRCKSEYGLQNCPNKIAEAIKEAWKEIRLRETPVGTSATGDN